MYLIKKSCLCWVKYFSAIAKFLLCNHVNTYSNTYVGHSFFFINEYNFYVYDPTKQQSVNIWGGATLMSPWSEVVPELACLHFGAILFSITQVTQAFNISEIFEHSDTLSPRALQCLVPTRYPTLFTPPPPRKKNAYDNALRFSEMVNGWSLDPPSSCNASFHCFLESSKYNVSSLFGTVRIWGARIGGEFSPSWAVTWCNTCTCNTRTYL